MTKDEAQPQNDNPVRAVVTTTTVHTGDDDRVSLAPLSGESALRALLATPPKGR